MAIGCLGLLPGAGGVTKMVRLLGLDGQLRTSLSCRGAGNAAETARSR